VPLKQYIPKSKPAVSKKYPKHITRAMRKKAALWRSYRRNKTLANKVAYSRQVDVCKSLVFEYDRSKELKSYQ